MSNTGTPALSPSEYEVVERFGLHEPVAVEGSGEQRPQAPEPAKTEEQRPWMAQTSWPNTQEEATADRLILHGARVAMAMAAVTDQLSERWFSLDKSDPEYVPARSRYLDAVSGQIAESQIVVALASLQQWSRDEADKMAARLWELTEDGGVLPELMWDYLTERGVDAEALWTAAQAEAHEHQDEDQS